MPVIPVNKSRGAKYKGSGGLPTPDAALVPNWLAWVCFFISFALPNLVFSGPHFFDTLHIMKWAVTMVPIGILTLAAGIHLLLRGAKRASFTLDPFGAAWFLLLIYVTLQVVIAPLSSLSTYMKEWFYFASLFALYMLAYNIFKSERLFRVILWGGGVNAAINVVFAELMTSGIKVSYPFILNVPGNYIGNTAQQEMFGLWMAMSLLNSLFLHVSYMGAYGAGDKITSKSRVLALASANMFFLAMSAWGLWGSTARGGILSFAAAVAILALCLWRTGKIDALKRTAKLFGVIIALLVVMLTIGSQFGLGQSGMLVDKMADMIKNPTSIGGRMTIWETSWEVFKTSPMLGVGLGHYKWHFLDGQRLLFQKPNRMDNPKYGWQYTYWAHSEYIQWLCETGIVGAAMLLLLGLWWLYAFIAAIAGRKNLSYCAIWGCSMTFLVWFDALFSRPFHRIENSVWMALAFALSNRELLPSAVRWSRLPDKAYRAFGLIVAGIAIYGFVFLAGGIMGDQLMYNALASPSDAQAKVDQLKKAEKYPMSRDDAREQLGYLITQIGDQQKDANLLTTGLNYLYEAFTKRPTAKLLIELAEYGRRFNSRELIGALDIYLTPGMFGTSPSNEQPEPASAVSAP
ncbi:O-antigen polymerase [Synergistales bacterium]|nr:O-antigen polymerase [Synergistales bacterium]